MMPPTTDNPTDRAREDGDDADWARWEQTFRDAKPVLPDAAIARIEESIRREAQRAATPTPSRLRRNILLLLLVLIGVNVAAVLLFVFHAKPDFFRTKQETDNRGTAPLVEDRYPMGVTVGPDLIAPDAPVLPIEYDLAWASGMGKWRLEPTPATRPAALALAKAAERLPTSDSHKLALSELRRIAGISGPRSSRQVSSNLADSARFDLLCELGYTKAQAALDVLTTRSYAELASMPPSAATAPSSLEDRQYANNLLATSRYLFDRLFALRLLGRVHEADQLLASAHKLRYLTDPQDMAVLLARLGPDEAWDRLLRPLMEDEVAFIQNPPSFDETAPRPSPEATVEAHAKSIQEGVTTYLGPSLQISTGPWRITCDKLTAFHNSTPGVLLSGAGSIQIHGVIGLLSASADEFTFNTETGELKLAGRVHLDGWAEPTDAKSCTISRTGEVRDVVR